MNFIFFEANSLSNYIYSLILSTSLIIFLYFFKMLLVRYSSRLSEKQTFTLATLFKNVLQKTRFSFLLLLAIYGGLQLLIMPKSAEAFIRTLMMIALLFQTGLWLMQVIAFFVLRWKIHHSDSGAVIETSAYLIDIVLKALLWIFLFLLLLENLGFDIRTLIAGLGIGGIAIALALQNILGDILASISLVVDKPFILGDAIGIDDFQGTVEHIGIKATTLRAPSGEQIIFSNADIFKSRLRNFQRLQERRLLFYLRVPYSTPLEKLEKIPSLIEAIIRGEEKMRFERVHFKEFGEVALVFEVLAYVLTSDMKTFIDRQQSVNFKIAKAFNKEDISFAVYPDRERKPL